uniref:Uncharacterized protein n=1 Tax=Timema genevievae TaxID=629358 RepID=A0A7R9PM08_TIMGE|nr:unnamed protein product [Timema genevievae]
MTRSHLTESCTETTKFNIHGTKKQLVTWAPTQSHTRETERGHRVSPLMLRLVCFCAGRCCGDGLIPGDPRRSPPLGAELVKPRPAGVYVPPHATAKYRLVAGYSDLIGVSRRATVRAPGCLILVPPKPLDAKPVFLSSPWMFNPGSSQAPGCLTRVPLKPLDVKPLFLSVLSGRTRVEKVVEVSRARYHDYHFALCKRCECVITTSLIKKNSSVLDVNSTTDYLLIVVRTTHSVRHLCLSVTAPIETNVSQAVSRPDTVTMPVTCLKQDTPSSSGRAAPLLAEPRFGAGPQPYSE